MDKIIGLYLLVMLYFSVGFCVITIFEILWIKFSYEPDKPTLPTSAILIFLWPISSIFGLFALYYRISIWLNRKKFGENNERL